MISSRINYKKTLEKKDLIHPDPILQVHDLKKKVFKK